MKASCGYKSVCRKRDMSLEEKVSELFSEFEQYDETKQKLNIEVMNAMIVEMNEKEFKTVFTTELFDKMNKLIEEKKMSMNNSILLLKCIGHIKILKNIYIYSFVKSSLNRKFEKMIADENEKKKEEKNEKLLADLCKCYLLLSSFFSSDLLSICVPCLLKVALKKEGNEEAQEEVEMVLLTLSDIWSGVRIERELFFHEMMEVLKYHQEHHNLTQLAYQSAWEFFVKRLFFDKNLDIAIVNKLHFAREARRELEELSKCVDWKRKEGWKGGKETKDALILLKWFKTLNYLFYSCRFRNEKFAGFICRLADIFRASRDNYLEVCQECIFTLRKAAESECVKMVGLLKGGAVDAVLEEMKQSTFQDGIEYEYLYFFSNISERLKEKKYHKIEEAVRKVSKMEIFEKMEKEGFEDSIASFLEIINFLNGKYYIKLSKILTDFFVNI